MHDNGVLLMIKSVLLMINVLLMIKIKFDNKN